MSATPSLSTAPDSSQLSGVFGLLKEATQTFWESRPKLGEAFAHHFSSPGKCMRARLCLQASQRLGLTELNGYALAATVEALHNASLVLDDLQDVAISRRGRSTVYAQFGEETALALTYCLTSSAFLCLQKTNTTCFSQLSAQTKFAVSETVLGQRSDLSLGPDQEIEDLKVVASLKSGPLFGLALTLPLLASGHESSIDQARTIAKKFGLGYQILDDIKDQSIDQLRPNDSNIANAIGKQVGAEEAEKIAGAEVHRLFTEAKEMALTLPKDCGSGIAELVELFQKTAK